MAGTGSSRSPEGVPNHCPVCDTDLFIEPSRPPGDVPCPTCGALLWFSRTPTSFRLYRFDRVAPIRDRIVALIREHLWPGGQPVELWNTFSEDIGADSLDVVELIMELEDEFGLSIPEEDAQRIKTVRDAIDYLVQRRL